MARIQKRNEFVFSSFYFFFSGIVESDEERSIKRFANIVPTSYFVDKLEYKKYRIPRPLFYFYAMPELNKRTILCA